jgi:cysteine synthase A
VLKARLPDVKIIGIQPESSKDKLAPGMRYQATDTRGGIIAEMLTESDAVDEIVRVSNEDARNMAHKLWKEEGLFAGVSSGANVHVALEEARKFKDRKRIVTVLPDRIDRYLSEERYVT